MEPLPVDVRVQMMKKKCRRTYTPLFAISEKNSTSLASHLPPGIHLSSIPSSLPRFYNDSINVEMDVKDIHHYFTKLISGDLPLTTGPHYVSEDKNFIIARKGFTFGIWYPSPNQLFHIYQTWDAPLYTYYLELEEDGTWRYSLSILPPGVNRYKIDARRFYVLFAGGDTRIEIGTWRNVDDEPVYVEELEHTYPEKTCPIIRNICSPWTKAYLKHLQESCLEPPAEENYYATPNFPPFLQNEMYGHTVNLDDVQISSPTARKCWIAYKEQMAARRARLLFQLYGEQ